MSHGNNSRYLSRKRREINGAVVTVRNKAAGLTEQTPSSTFPTILTEVFRDFPQL